MNPQPSWMRAEIEAIPVLLAEARSNQATVDALAARISAHPPTAIVIAGRGTSDHAALYARYLLELTIGVPASLAAPSLVTLYGARPDWRHVLVLAISQSGGSPDLLAVIDAARQGGAVTCGIVNDVGSELAGLVDVLLPIGAGPERSVAATKSYVLALDTIARLAAATAATSWARALSQVPETARHVLDASSAWMIGEGAPLVDALAKADRALVVSRGMNLATALEVALKLKETAQIFADGYSAADLMHGPVSLGGPDVPAIVFRPDGPTVPSIDASLSALGLAGSPAWTIGTPSLRTGSAALALPCDLPEPLTPIALVLPGYLLAEQVARRRGLDPDRPRGLAKVTKTS